MLDNLELILTVSGPSEAVSAFQGGFADRLATQIYESHDYRRKVGNIAVLGYLVADDKLPSVDELQALGCAYPGVCFRFRRVADDSRGLGVVSVYGSQIEFSAMHRGGVVRIAERAEPSVVRAAQDAASAEQYEFWGQAAGLLRRAWQASPDCQGERSG